MDRYGQQRAALAQANYRWTEDRVGILVREWRIGTAINTIAGMVGCTRSTLVSKAQQLHLGNHPSSRASKLADRLAAPPEEPEAPPERPKPKMPHYTFLERRFGWELG